MVELPTYYPGTTIPGEVRSISVARGAVQSGIDFVLQHAPAPKGPVGVFFLGDHQQGRGSQAQFVDGAPIRILFLEDSYRAMPNDIPEGYTVTSIKQGTIDLMKDPLKIPSVNTSDIVVTIRGRQ